MKRFAKTIVKVLLAYADIVKVEFPQYAKDQDERVVSSKFFQQQVKNILLIKCIHDLLFIII